MAEYGWLMKLVDKNILGTIISFIQSSKGLHENQPTGSTFDTPDPQLH